MPALRMTWQRPNWATTPLNQLPFCDSSADELSSVNMHAHRCRLQPGTLLTLFAHSTGPDSSSLLWMDATDEESLRQQCLGYTLSSELQQRPDKPQKACTKGGCAGNGRPPRALAARPPRGAVPSRFHSPAHRGLATRVGIQLAAPRSGGQSGAPARPTPESPRPAASWPRCVPPPPVRDRVGEMLVPTDVVTHRCC